MAGLAKSMRNAEDVMADYIADGESKLSDDELRLVDLKVFKKTGKHIGKFKDKPAGGKPGGKDKELSISKYQRKSPITGSLVVHSEATVGGFIS